MTKLDEIIARGLCRNFCVEGCGVVANCTKWKRYVSSGESQAVRQALTDAGYAIVPVEPTDKMMAAGFTSIVSPSVLKYRYRAMVEAVKEEQ